MGESKYFQIEYKDGAKNRLTFFGSKKNQIALLILPAMGIRATYYAKFSTYLAAHYPITIVTADYRGHGHSSLRPSRKIDYGFKEMLSDCQENVGFIKKNTAIKKVYLLGHSIGGQLGCLYVARYNNVDKLIILGASLPYYKIWKGWGIFKLWLGGILSYPLSLLFGNYPGNLIGFAGIEGVTVMRDWSHAVRTGLYKVTNDSYDYEEAMAIASPDIFALSFPQDNLAPPYTVKYLLEKFKSQDQIIHHTIDGYNHFNWTKSPQKIAPIILSEF